MPEARASGNSGINLLLFAFGGRRHAAGSAAMKAWNHQGSGDTARYFLIRRKTAGCLFGKGKTAVNGDLEDSATAFAQSDLGGWICLQNQIPRCDGTRLIASHAAIFDLDLHLIAIPRLVGALPAWQRPSGWARKGILWMQP
jgi:hypothetical protein